jgi:hypothetical protein
VYNEGWLISVDRIYSQENEPMTQLLEKAYSQVAQLPHSEQDAIAALILDALADEEQWTEQFANSQDALAKLALEALAEHQAGKTLPLDPKAL